MDLDFTEEQKMFRTAVREFAQKEVDPLVEQAEKTETCPKELFAKMGKLGYLCPRYPTELGGGGMGVVGNCIMVEEMARVCSGIISGIMVHGGVATYAIAQWGTPEQKEEFLLPAIRGDKIAAYGLTEPNAGSDAASIETTARRDGDFYIINGTKNYITNGYISDFVTLAAVTDKSRGAKGISSIIVEKGTPGFTAKKLRKLGQHSADTAELAFEDCRVPVANLIGEEGNGLRYALEALTPARISHSARSIGVATAAFDASLSYAKERKQFGQAVGKFQAIGFKLAQMATDLEAARCLLYQVAKLYDAGLMCRKEASMTKMFSSDMAVRSAEGAMRIHAGAGYLAESSVQRYFRDAILFHVTEGTTEIQQIMISRELGL